MGLDLVHARPSVKTDETFEYFTLDEFEEFPGFIERHKNLIVEVIEDCGPFNIYIFLNEEYRSQYERNFGIKENITLLVGDINKLTNEVSEIEWQREPWKDGKFITEDSIRANNAIKPLDIPYININYPAGYNKKQVVYWKEIGYQRKGVTQDFYENFDNCKLYFRKEDVVRASTYLSVNDKQRPGLFEHFKEAFIDNFVEGESIFFASW